LPQQVAGVEVYTSRLLTGQCHEDEVGLVTARVDRERRSGDLVRSHWEGVPVYEVIQNRDASSFAQTWHDARLSQAFRSVFDAFEPDVLHVQHLMNLTLSLVEIAKEKRIPIVMTLHDHWWSCANGGQRFHPDRRRCESLDASTCGRCTWSSVGPMIALRGALRRRREARIETESSGEESVVASASGPSSRMRALQGVLARRLPTPFGAQRIERRWRAMRGLADDVDLFLAPSRDLAEAAREFGFPARRVQVLRHGMPFSKKQGSRARPFLAEHFGYLGSLVPHKGVHHLVAAFAEMPDNARLSVYGSLKDDPGYVRELREIARHPGIRFLGEVDPTSVIEVLARLDCLVVPSIWRENAPLTVQEAFVAGTPVVVSDLGGLSELVEAGGGLLVPAGDEAALRAALQRLSSESELVLRLAAGISTPRSIEDHLSDLRRIYSELLAGNPGSQEDTIEMAAQTS